MLSFERFIEANYELYAHLSYRLASTIYDVCFKKLEQKRWLTEELFCGTKHKRRNDLIDRQM